MFSVRLDHAELAALERSAALVGLKPSELARRLIRRGLTGRDRSTLDAAVGDVVQRLGELQRELSAALD